MGSFIINIRIHKFHIAIARKGLITQWKGIGRLRWSVNPNYEKSWRLIDIYQ